MSLSEFWCENDERGVSEPRSYLICGTPRTGSSYLCDLLASTGVAGRPESYFREPDQQEWATRFAVEVSRDGSFDHQALVEGALRAGTSPNGVFAARVMWGTLDSLVGRLAGTSGNRPDVEVLTEVFGRLLFVHLRRNDVVGQAVSWARAEQTAYWQEGDTEQVDPRFDFDEVDGFVRTIRAHNAGWDAWFAQQRVRPQVVTYEELVDDPGGAVMRILRALQVEVPPGWRPRSAHVRQADEVNRDWVRRYLQGPIS